MENIVSLYKFYCVCDTVYKVKKIVGSTDSGTLGIVAKGVFLGCRGTARFVKKVLDDTKPHIECLAKYIEEEYENEDDKDIISEKENGDIVEVYLPYRTVGDNYTYVEDSSVVSIPEVRYL